MYVIQINQNPDYWDLFASKQEADFAANALHLAHHRDVDVKVMTLLDFEKWADTTMCQPPFQISEDVWEQCLCILPPENHIFSEKFEHFRMRERISGNYTMQYGRIGKIYLSKTINVEKEETWLCMKDFENKAPLRIDLTDFHEENEEKIA